ncbi:MAG: phage tail tape measure protein [Flavobacteriaceae bacterium]|nr:phage tail tape measure protein [Flavobacteriaceae bacterium]
MPQKIENKDIFSADFLEPQKKSFKEIIELIKLMESEMKDVLKVQQQLVKTSDKKSVEGLKKRQRAVQSVNQVSKEMLKLEKQRKAASAQLQIAETKEAKAVAATRIELSRKKKAVKDEILAEKGLVSEYQKQSATLNNLRKKYKDLILVQGKETRATKKLRKEITTLDKRLKKVDAATGQFQRSVGNYGKAFGKVTGVLRNFGLAVGGLAVIRNITGIVRGFEQAQADLASVLGVNVEGMKALTDQARELGATTRFTAGEVSQLQKEFAKLGFDQTEIQAMTEATLQLAAATGTELPRAAEVTGATLRGFGLDASETQRVVDVMAKSFSSSSLDMEKFATAMSSVAPVAKTAGLSVEKTTALLGTLTDRGLDASTAGTGLRNIFLELSKRGLSFEEAMLQINSATDKNAASLELFGKRGATVGTILSETAEDVSNLEGKLNDAGGAAKEMADKQLNTLNGALDLLKSAWEGFILDLEEGTGVFGGLKDIIFAVARNFTTIVKVIKTAAIAWGSYRIALMLVNKETGKFKRFGLISFFRKLVLGLKGLAKGGKSAALSLRGIGTAMKSIPLVAWIAGITTAISLIWDLVTGTDQATKEQNRLNDELREEIRLRKELSELRRTELAGITERVQAISKLSAAGIGQLVEDITGEIGKLQLELDDVNATVNKFDEQSANAFTTWGNGGAAVQQTANGMFQVNDLVQDARKNSEILTETQSESKEELEKQLSVLQDQLKIVKDFKPINKSNNSDRAKSIKKQLTGLEKLKKELSDIRKLRSDELVINGETVLFQRYTDQTKELTTQIELLEARLKLSEEGFKAQKKGVVTDVSEITGEEDLREEANKAVDDFVNIQVEGAEEIADNDKKYYEQRLAALREFAAKAIEIANAKTDKEIENVDKELEANKNRQKQLEALAAQGNLTAQQSLSAEIKRELELERQKEALEKKKARRQIILEGLDLLSSKIDSGQKDAVTSTLNDMTRLLGALAALPGFIDGTETTVGAALGKPQLNTGTDDYIVRVDGSEKILNPGMSARTGNMTTEEITRAAEMYSSGMFDQNVLIHPQVAALNQPFQNSNEILKKFDSLESTIRNKPILSDLKFDDLQKALVVTVEQNGDLKRAHYKLK